MPSEAPRAVHDLDCLDQISIDVIIWSPEERQAAGTSARAWDRWTSDVSDHPLPDHPTVLLPYVALDFRHGRRVRGLTDFARGVRQAGYRDGPFGRQQSPGPPLTDRFRAARTADMADSDMVVHRLIPRGRDRHGPATRGRAEIAY